MSDAAARVATRRARNVDIHGRKRGIVLASVHGYADFSAWRASHFMEILDDPAWQYLTGMQAVELLFDWHRVWIEKRDARPVLRGLILAYPGGFERGFGLCSIVHWRTAIAGARLEALLSIGSLEELDLFGCTVSPDALRLLVEGLRLRYLGLPWDATDGDLECLGSMTNLVALNLRGTEVRGPGLAWLAKCPELRALDLGFTDLSGDGIAHLRKLSKLEELVLDGCPLLDIHMDTLAQMRTLRVLNISHTPLGDEGLGKIARMRHLQRVIVADTRASNDAVAHLTAQLHPALVDTNESSWMYAEIPWHGTWSGNTQGWSSYSRAHALPSARSLVYIGDRQSDNRAVIQNGGYRE